MGKLYTPPPPPPNGLSQIMHSDFGGLLPKNPSLTRALIYAGVAIGWYTYSYDVMNTAFFWGMKSTENKKRAADAELHKKNGEPSD